MPQNFIRVYNYDYKRIMIFANFSQHLITTGEFILHIFNLSFTMAVSDPTWFQPFLSGYVA